MENLIESVVGTQELLEAKKKFEENYSYWKDSPFYALHALSSKSKGTAMQNIAIEICKQHYNLKIELPNSSDYDSVISGYKTEIKNSMSWNNKPNNWKWQQIRRGQKYDRIIFVGINIDEYFMWWATKNDLNQYVFPIECNKGQHGGGKAASDTYWESCIDIKQLPPYFKTMDQW